MAGLGNSVNAPQQGVQYQSSSGAWSGLDGSTSGKVLTSNGTGSAPSFQTFTGGTGVVTVQVFSSTGAFTYTPTAGMKSVIVELVGGGGGGGGCASSVGGIAIGGSGGSGAYVKFLLTAAQVGASLTGSVGVAGTGATSGNNAGGSGGNTTLATSSSWTAEGGVGGNGSASGAVQRVLGGQSGNYTAGTGILIFSGYDYYGMTGAGVAVSTTVSFTGQGGSNPLGFGGRGVFNTPGSIVADNGNQGNGYGSGASGSITWNSASSINGLGGVAGVAIFTESS